MRIHEVVNPKIFNDIENSLPMFGTKPVRIGDYMFDVRTYRGGVGDFDAKGLQIRAYDPKNLKRSIGSVDFIVKKDKKGREWLESDDTEVDPEYQGKGVATLMYAFAKSLGNDIKPSPYQSVAGQNMWRKWGKDADNLKETAGKLSADAKDIVKYINSIHPEALTKHIEDVVLSYPKWKLETVNLHDLHIPDQDYDDPDQEPEEDPYNRVMVVDPSHAEEVSSHYIDKRPIVIDHRGFILDGNHRAWAAAELYGKDTIRAWVPK